jgi:hypothetical protein
MDIHPYETLDDFVPLGPTGIGAVPILEKDEPIADLRSLSHQFAIMTIAVLPLVKLSKNGPVVSALAVLIDGTVAPSFTSVW